MELNGRVSRTRGVLRVASRSAEPSPVRGQSYDPVGHAAGRLANGSGTASPRPKDDIVLKSAEYQLGSPRSRAEASQSLARVMEIQRQAAMMPHYPSAKWLDSFMQTRALEENTRYQHVAPQGAPFENLYNQLAETAVKNTERCQPLKCPNFPKLPKKKHTRKSSRRNKDAPAESPESPTRPSSNNEEQARPPSAQRITYNGSPAMTIPPQSQTIPASALQYQPTYYSTAPAPPAQNYVLYTAVAAPQPPNQPPHSSATAAPPQPHPIYQTQFPIQPSVFSSVAQPTQQTVYTTSYEQASPAFYQTHESQQPQLFVASGSQPPAGQLVALQPTNSLVYWSQANGGQQQFVQQAAGRPVQLRQPDQPTLKMPQPSKPSVTINVQGPEESKSGGFP